jgi:lipoprotein-anchoring transpeptidase ErfK/SrfK
VRRSGLALLFLVGFALAGGASAAVRDDPPASTTTTTVSVTTTTVPATTTTVPATTTTVPATTTTVPTTTTTPVPTTTTPTTTVAPPRAQVLPARVKVAGVAVGRMIPTEAFLVVQQSLPQSLDVTVGRTKLTVSRAALGATDYLWNAIRKAKSAAPGADVEVSTAVKGAAVRAYVARLAKRFDRAPVDATLRLRHIKPVVSKDRAGFRVQAGAAARELVAALKAHDSGPVALPTRVLEPAVTRGSIGPVIVIDRGRNELDLYRGMRPWKQFAVATGQQIYPTPLGRFQIVSMWKNPWWTPPASPWAAGAEPIPPGPGNPLGTRWMGISSPGVGIHGTPDAASLGYSASHGCIRMAIPQAEWLFNHVAVGTPVYIVAA